ncbi:MAG TPA: hypothetical protein VFT64_05315 [Rickettsiales bacterium]|nr:hypothetical protein [Rickettsiales bacterium]
MKKKSSSDISKSYNSVKEFEGKQYTGMKIGRTHHWHYDQGDWKEKKVTPEKWELTYSTVKRRAGKAPEGSGVPVGTAYHWFILAHQYVEKLNANDYMTQMVGLKYKLSHRRAEKGEWNASGSAQRNHLIKILKSLIEELERNPEQLTPVPLNIEYKNKLYTGNAIPVPTACQEGACYNLDITLNGEHMGIMRYDNGKWKITEIKSQGLVNAIGEQIMDWYKHAA